MRPHLRYASYVARHKWFVLRAGLRTGAPLWRPITDELIDELVAEAERESVVKLRATLVIEWDVDLGYWDYGTTDPERIAAIEGEEFLLRPGRAFDELSPDAYTEVAVEVVR